MARLDTVTIESKKHKRRKVINAHDWQARQEELKKRGFKVVGEDLRRSEEDEDAEAQATADAESKAAAGGGGRTKDTKKAKK